MQWYGVHKRRYNRLNLNIDQARKNMQIARMKETPPRRRDVKAGG